MHVIGQQGGVQSKVVRLFLGGDYEFLLENYDQSSAASKDFCLWCPAKTENRRDDPFTMNPCWGEGHLVNTLESLKERSRNGGDPIFRFPLCRVVVLPLHLTLGLTAQYLTLLKAKVRTLFQLESNKNNK